MDPVNIAIIAGSTRPGRTGTAVAAWIHEQASERDAVTYKIFDLEDTGLPLRNQARFALPGNFPDRIFTPGPEHHGQATDLFNQLELWAGALRTVRS